MSGTQRPRNRTKAVVRFERRADGEVALKDYAARPLWLRVTYGRPSLAREAAAYARLDGVPGVPRCFGHEGRDTLVLERAPGRPLSEWATPPPPSVFDRLEAILAAIHARGVAIADLHRSNVIVADDGAVHIVDFAMALLARDAARPGRAVRLAQSLDRHAVARLRAKAFGQPEPPPPAGLGTAYRLGRRIKALLR